MAYKMIPIYIAMTKKFEVIKGMTEYSILANSDEEVDINYLYPKVESGCTGFSNIRYEVKYGIYLDPDMIVLGDIADLWAYREPGKFVCMGDGSTEVAVIDCSHDCRDRHHEYLLPMSRSIPPEWNVEDHLHYDWTHIPLDSKILHFTALDTQPWFHEHPNQAWVEEYKKWAI